MDCSLLGSSVHGIFQARVLKWVTISFSRGSSQPRDQTWVSCVAGSCFTSWATREACIYIYICIYLLLLSHSVLSNCLGLHGLQHTRLPCPSPSLEACSNSSPMSWYYYLTISSSASHFYFCLQSFPASGKTLESPLDCKEIKSINPKGNQPWMSLGRTDAEAPIYWPPDAKS